MKSESNSVGSLSLALIFAQRRRWGYLRAGDGNLVPRFFFVGGCGGVLFSDGSLRFKNIWVSMWMGYCD